MKAKAFELFPVTVDVFGYEEKRVNPKARNYTRHQQGVYLLKKRGVVRYVGSSVGGPGSAPLRMWKTIMRHFQACGPVAPGHYAFGEDNFCTSSRNDWRIVLYVTPQSTQPEYVRDLEAYHIARHKPADQAQKKEPAKARKKPRRKN